MDNGVRVYGMHYIYSMEFSKEETVRYSRQTNLRGFGTEGQAKLKATKVLVVGAGGLGAPLLTYLASAGVGTIGIVDDDIVELHNLHRQILYTQSDIGKSKAHIAAQRLQELNPNITVRAYNLRLQSENAIDIINGYDIIADGTDNFPTRYLVNDACVKLGKINVFASVLRFEGQLTVFNFPNDDGTLGPNYRDLYPTPPDPALIPNCAEAGVLGAAAGAIACMQGTEILKIAAGLGTQLSGKLLYIDLQNMETRSLIFKKTDDHGYRYDNSQNIELIDYEAYCHSFSKNTIAQMDAKDAMTLLEQDLSVQFIDVREENEYVLDNIGAKNIPLSQLENCLDILDPNVMTIVHCQTGRRSAAAIEKLKKEYGFKSLVNLKGGIVAVRKVIRGN